VLALTTPFPALPNPISCGAVRPDKERRAARGFTLVELLVVIAIIGTLGTLVALGARTAISSSRQSVCAGNLRNIGIALHLYAEDHGGKFPETTHSGSLDAAWVYQLETYLGDFDNIRVCPEDPKRKERIKARGTSYILNSFIFVPEVDPFGEPVGSALNRLSAIPDPSRTMIAFTCSDRTGTGPGNDHTHSNQWSSWSAVTRDISPGRFGGTTAGAAKGRSNYLYVDGRVESIRAAEVKRKINSGNNIAYPPGLKSQP
jgi:prepilin-type N-terminal cleavage/methylation domain-containing protein/prepilin-type processing-associated H-X9-DG protein